MEHFRTNIVLKPKVTAFEKAFGIFIIAFIFIPFAIGIFTQNTWLPLSLPIGIFLIFVFNLVTKGKFKSKNWVQKDSFVEFTLSGIKIINGAEQKEFLWTGIEGVQLSVKNYDGEPNEDSTPHSGTDNKLIFNALNTRYEFNFYLKDAEQKQAIRSFLQSHELKAANIRPAFKGTYLAEVSGTKEEDPGKSKKGRGCLILFATPFVLLGLALIVAPIYQFSKVIQAKSWIPTNAKVLSAGVVSTTSGRSTGYQIEMEYEYVAGNETFIGNKASFNLGKDNIEHYYELAEKLRNSKIIEVYVNPNDPYESVVVRGVTNAMVMIVIVAIMWNSLLLTFALPMLRKTEVRKMLLITFVIWTLCICKFIFHVGDINISEKLTVIEAKEEQE